MHCSAAPGGWTPSVASAADEASLASSAAIPTVEEDSGSTTPMKKGWCARRCSRSVGTPSTPATASQMRKRSGSQRPASHKETSTSEPNGQERDLSKQKPVRKTFFGQDVDDTRTVESITDVFKQRGTDFADGRFSLSKGKSGCISSTATDTAKAMTQDAVNFSVTMLKRSAPKTPFIIHPDHAAKLTWDVIGLLLLLYTVVITPIRLGFSLRDTCPQPIWVWEAFIDWFFFADLLLNFMTGVEVDAYISFDPGVIAVEYLRTWFIIDLLSSLPIDFILTLAIEGCPPDDVSFERTSNTRALKMVRVLRLVKLLKVVRVLKLQALIDHLTDHAPGLFNAQARAPAARCSPPPPPPQHARAACAR
eukprot:7381318-Prymnesium_polylepis.1